MATKYGFRTMALSWVTFGFHTTGGWSQWITWYCNEISASHKAIQPVSKTYSRTINLPSIEGTFSMSSVYTLSFPLCKRKTSFRMILQVQPRMAIVTKGSSLNTYVRMHKNACYNPWGGLLDSLWSTLYLTCLIRHLWRLGWLDSRSSSYVLSLHYTQP